MMAATATADQPIDDTMNEDIDMPSDEEDEEDEDSDDPVEDLDTADEQGPADLTAAMLECILNSMNFGDSRSAETTQEIPDEKEEILRKCDLLWEKTLADPLYNSPLLQEPGKSRVRQADDRFQWAKPGVLCWIKHPEFDWWPGIIKRVTKAKGAKSITQQAKCTVMFLEPQYTAFLSYVKRAPSYSFTSVLPFTSMEPPQGGTQGRPLEQIERSQRSWLTCTKYLDFTFFEISERMAVVCEIFLDKLVIKGAGTLRLNIERLAGLYWLANLVWLKMNGSLLDVPKNPPSAVEWTTSLSLLEDVSYWRHLADEVENNSENHKKQKEEKNEKKQKKEKNEKNDKKQKEEDEFFEEEEEEEDEEGCYGFEFIQIGVQRDSSKINYSKNSEKIVQKRENYAKKLLEVVFSAECRIFLKRLRDKKDETERTKAWFFGDEWKLINQGIKSPSGPIVSDVQVFSLYRFMRCLRRREDTDNVKFLRACYDVWLPEALIYAIMKVKQTSYEEAEKEYAAEPLFVPEEIEAKWNLAAQSMAKSIHRTASD